MRFTTVVILLASGALASPSRSTTSSSTPSAASTIATVTLPDVSTIGTFNLSSLGSEPPYFAFRTRQNGELLPGRTIQVRHGNYFRKLPKGKQIEPAGIVNGTVMDTNAFMDKYGQGGIMVVQHGSIVLEQQQYGDQSSSQHVVQSCTKSFLTTVLGIAIREGKISLKDRADYWIPELHGSPYGDVPLQNLVDMTAGVRIPDGFPNIQTGAYQSASPTTVLELFKTYNKFAKPGETFFYLDQNYYVASVALSRAVNETIQSYVTRNIWEPAGMQYDGFMRQTIAGQVDGHGGLAITLADQARFGLFVLDSLLEKTRRPETKGPKVPNGWFQAISTGNTAKGIRAPGVILEMGDFGYQTGWWICPKSKKRAKYALGDDGGFAALGWGGQTIYVIPKLEAIVVMQSSYPIHVPELFTGGMEFATAIALELKKNQ